MSANVAGTSPELVETPALLNKITSRSFAKPSVTAGFQIVHSPGIVLIEDERHAVRLAEAAIGEADAVGLGELRRRGLVRVLGH
jgi:hypothetical protein